MKYKLLMNNSESKKEVNIPYKDASKNLCIDFFHNKLLNNMIDSYINKGIISISNRKGKNIHLSNRKKSPSISSYNKTYKRISSAKLKMDLFPKNYCNSIDSENKNTNTDKKTTVKHTNYSAMNISDNSYNFHQNEQKKIINEDKKLLLYFNNNKDKVNEENEDEKCDISPRYYDFEYKKKEVIKNSVGSQTTINFNNINKSNSKKFQKTKFLEATNNSKTQQPTNQEEKNTQIPLQHSQSTKNSLKPLLAKKNRELEKITTSIKEEVKNYFVKHRFSSVKDYFNDWLYYNRKKDYQKKVALDEDNIYYYLKEKLGIKIYRKEVEKIFKCKRTLFDINMFKNFFFEENSGRKVVNINDNLLLKQTVFNSYRKFKKNKDNIITSLSNIIKNNGNKMPSFKNNLLVTTLKEHKAKILDRIGNNFVENNKKNEFDYLEFSNLFQNLNMDKKFINKKLIKKVFDKYKNENEKINIKYFINNLNNDEAIKDELFTEKEIYKINIPEYSKKINILNYYNSNPINLHLNKIEFKSKYKTQLINNILKNNSKDFLSKSPFHETEKYKFKSTTPHFKSDVNYNKYNNSPGMGKFMKFNESKTYRKFKKKKFFSLYDSSLKVNNLADTMRIGKQKAIKLNNYKTIRIRKKYQSNTNILNNATTKINENKAKQLNSMKRPGSSYVKCLFGINNNNRNCSGFINTKTLKLLSEDSRVQNLNSDIINLI